MRIGVFDSGIGGLTVLKELRKRFAEIDFVYLGDTAHVPYGAKSPAQIEKLSLACAEVLRKKQIDALVVACNTASSWALSSLRKAMDPVPVFGVVDPGIRAVCESVRRVFQSHGPIYGEFPILILATRATVQSGAYGQSLRDALASDSDLQGIDFTIYQQPCPLLVPMIEEGWIQHPILKATVQQYLEPYSPRGPGVALLGCTHYPWIHSVFEQALPGWEVVNSAQAIVRALEQSSLLDRADHSLTLGGQVEWFFTDPEAVPDFIRAELNRSPQKEG